MLFGIRTTLRGSTGRVHQVACCDKGPTKTPDCTNRVINRPAVQGKSETGAPGNMVLGGLEIGSIAVKRKVEIAVWSPNDP